MEHAHAANSFTTYQMAGAGDVGGSNGASGFHKPLPAFHQVSFWKGSQLLFRKPLSNMAKPTKISLKIGGGGSFSASSPATGTPTPGGGNKIRLSFGGASKPGTPSEVVVTPKAPKTKAGRAPKPSAKLVANKNGKRVKDEEDDDDTIRVDTSLAVLNPKKKIKFSLGATTPKTPFIKAKFKGKPPKRPLGEGYDSEASDREEDPTIEEEWMLRMIPGDDCEYLRMMINERRIGLPKSQGGAEVSFKFFQSEGRRAAITIRQRVYAATMVDLPCIVEGMKSWDKKGWYKSADICQMLLVFAPIAKESDAETIDLPKIIDPNTFQYPHGLTAPMHNARKRRFRKRIRREAIEAVENAVEKLLADDAASIETRFEMIDPDVGSRRGSYGSPDAFGNDEDEYSADEDADADGEIDDGGYFNHHNGVIAEETDADLEAEMEAAFMNEDLFAAETPSSNAVADTPMVGIGEGEPQMEDSGDESLEDDDDDDDADGDSEDEVDEDERARNAELQGAREDIAEYQRQLEVFQAQYAAQSNPILKSRIKNNIEKVKAELQLKKSAIGEGDED